MKASHKEAAIQLLPLWPLSQSTETYLPSSPRLAAGLCRRLNAVQETKKRDGTGTGDKRREATPKRGGRLWHIKGWMASLPSQVGFHRECPRAWLGREHTTTRKVK